MMKRGAYDLGRYLFYFLVAALLLAAPILTIRSYTTQGFYETLQREQQTEHYLFSRYLVDCLSARDASAIHLGVIDLQQFTDQRLKSCTSEPVAVTLQLPDQVGVRIAATEPSLKQYTSLITLYKETVLVDGKRALLTVGAEHA